MFKKVSIALLSLVVSSALASCSLVGSNNLDKPLKGEAAKNAASQVLNNSIAKMDSLGNIQKTTITADEQDWVIKVKSMYNRVVNSQDLAVWQDGNSDDNFGGESILVDKRKASALYVASNIIDNVEKLECTFKDRFVCSNDNRDISLTIAINDEGIATDIITVFADESGLPLENNTHIEYSYVTSAANSLRGGLAIY